jgi:DNA sulfur modification protein DndE
MQLTKFKLSIFNTNQLRLIRGTGLTPNILCRIGFCLSLQSGHEPKPTNYLQDGKEFNRYTLLGEWDGLYVALLRQWCEQKLGGEYSLEDQFRAHMNNGIPLVREYVHMARGRRPSWSIKGILDAALKTEDCSA